MLTEEVIKAGLEIMCFQDIHEGEIISAPVWWFIYPVFMGVNLSDKDSGGSSFYRPNLRS